MMRSLALLVCGFALGTWLSTVRAQEPLPGNDAIITHADTGQIAHGQHDLTLTEVLDILTEYDLRHQDPVGFVPSSLWGVTIYETAQPTIFIMNRGDLRSRKSTLIHELTHIHYRNKGVLVPEKFVDAEEERQMQELYGVAH